MFIAGYRKYLLICNYFITLLLLHFKSFKFFKSLKPNLLGLLSLILKCTHLLGIGFARFAYANCMFSTTSSF